MSFKRKCSSFNELDCWPFGLGLFFALVFSLGGTAYGQGGQFVCSKVIQIDCPELSACNTECEFDIQPNPNFPGSVIAYHCNSLGDDDHNADDYDAYLPTAPGESGFSEFTLSSAPEPCAYRVACSIYCLPTMMAATNRVCQSGNGTPVAIHNFFRLTPVGPSCEGS